VGARARCARTELVFDAEPVATIVPLAAHDLRLLILNLADRAVRVAGAGGQIEFVVRADADTVSMHVVCGSSPLDESEQAWLADQAVDGDHIDLGLRVVRHLVEQHGGRIASADGRESRSGLAVTLPGAASA
jgi:signal transduction histidine kinase